MLPANAAQRNAFGGKNGRACLRRRWKIRSRDGASVAAVQHGKGKGGADKMLNRVRRYARSPLANYKHGQVRSLRC